MANVTTTTTQATALVYPGVSRIARQTNGHLWVAIVNNAGTGVDFYRSTDGGGSWALYGSWSKGVAILEMSGLHIDNGGGLNLAYRTNESSQDRVYWRRAVATAPSSLTSAEVMVGNPANGAVAGSIHTGLDMQVVLMPDGTSRVAVGVGTVVAGRAGVTLYGARRTTTGSMVADNAVTGGTRQWLFTGTGRITPQLDIEHTGDAKSSGVPHLWVSFGRTDVRLVKCAWASNRWVGPTAAITLKPGVAAQDCMVGRWDGERFLQAVPNPDAGLTDTVLVMERNRANSATVWRSTTPHPAGVVTSCTVSYGSYINAQDFRVYAVGTASTVLYYCDFVRKTSTWSAWTQVSASTVTGGNNYGARRETYGNARYDVVHQQNGVSPYTVVHTQQVVGYPPDVPVWLFGTGANTPPANGAAADVAASLRLDWLFSDPAPLDAQTAWSLSRQIGVAAIQYWRTSDSTWQAAEVKNVGATTEVTLTTTQWLGAGGATDLPHSYKVKVWDGTDVASLYSDALVVVPSAKVNPTITAPAAAAVLTSDTVTATWTVSEQSAYRVTLATNPGGVVAWDTGWIGSAQLSYTPPVRLGDLTGWTLTVQTRNLEGLPSTVQTVNFTVDYLEPAIPTVVATPMATSGFIRVTITNPVPGGGQPALADQDLYRRVVGTTDEGIRVAAGLASGAVQDDWRAVSGVAYEYRVLARGANGTSVYGAWTP